MDFPDGTLVRLRSRARGTYLYADDFGVGVSLSPRRASPGSEWELRRVLRGGVAFVVLRAASSRRYLALSPHNQQGPRIVQRGCEAPAHPSVMWMALDVWAAAGGGRRFVLLRHVFGLPLRADGRRSGVTAADLHVPYWMMHWAVEVSPLRAAPPALLPAPGTAPDRRRTVKIHVPILTPERVSGVILPIVDGRNTIVGSILGSTAMGLVEVAQGRGQELLVRAGLLQEQLGRGHLAQGLAALAFVPSRSWGHATRTLRSLPLNIALEDDEDEDGGREDAAAAGNVRGNAADVDHGANDQERPGGEGHDAHADVDDGANDQERPGGEGHDAHADVDDGANDQERPGGEGHDAQGGAAVDVPLDAAELEAGAAAQGVVDAAGGVAEDMLGYLQEVYQIMHKKFDQVQMLVAEKRAIDEAAAARGDWTGVAQLHRSRQKAIDNAIIEFDDMSEKAARLRNWLVSHSVAAPSPPRGARVHPNSLLPRRRRG